MAAKTTQLPLGKNLQRVLKDRKVAPNGKVMREAQKLAQARGARLVWLDDYLVANGEVDQYGAKSTMALRGKTARTRYAENRAAKAEAAAQAKAERAAKRAARKAAKAS